MNRPPEQQGSNRFSGSLRHYHRSGAQERSWDDWVEGAGGRRESKRNWWKILGVSLAILALAGIITGLIIELR